MKKFLTFALVLLVSAPALFSQDNDCGWRERIRSERVAFITEELGLTPAEAEKFWPVYNEFRDRKAEAQREIRETYKALDEAVKAGIDVSSCLDAYVTAIDAKSGIETEALKAYRKVLPAEKIAKLYLSEERFRMQQIHRLHHGPDGQGMPGPDRGPGKRGPGRPGR